jgi:DNA polymerase-3 subunit alpha
VLDKMKSKYLEGCSANGHDPQKAEKIWKDWEAFASYAFNKSHSTCYAFLAFQTAFLKTHHPGEFMASVLNHSGSIDKISFFMEECKRMGIKVLGPDVNEGFDKFSVMPDGNIRFGMSSIKGVGDNTIQNILQERNRNGKFSSIFDLAKRLDNRCINKKSLEALALAGGFDSFGQVHRAMFFVEDADGGTLIDRIIRYSNQQANGSDTSQSSLFSGDQEIEISEPQLPNVAPWTALEQLSREKEVVGFFISGHPLDPFRFLIENRCTVSCAQLKAGLEPFKNREVVFAGIVSGSENRTSKTGNPYGKLIVEDYQGQVDLMLFGKDFVEYNKFMVPGLFVFIKARVQERYNQPGALELKITRMDLLEEMKSRAFSRIRLTLKLDELDDNMVGAIEQLALQYPGTQSLELYVEDPNANQNIKLHSSRNKVLIDSGLLDALKKVDRVRFELA